MAKTTAKHYHNSPSSYAKKKAYDKAYNKTEPATKKRVELNKINRKSQASGKTSVGDGKDYSHTIKGYEAATKNRGRAEKSRLKGSKRS